MANEKKYVSFKNRMLIIGFGSIGQGSLPLLLRHIDIKPEQITIVTADERGRDVAKQYGIEFVIHPVTQDNFREVLGPRVSAGDFIVNLSVDVSCPMLMEYCQEKGALYLDTVVEFWAGFYTDSKLTPSQRSNYGMREMVRELRQKHGNGHTAVSCHGANPGLVTHFVKQALLDIAAANGVQTPVPATREAWGLLMEKLGIKVIHVAERDTQVANQPKDPGEFVNTWSIDGFFSEGMQPAELGWGTHEKEFPADGGQHDYGSGAAIYLNRPGGMTKVRSWTPLEGPYQGFLVTHDESISIPEYFSVYDNGKLRHRVTCHYAYHPCDDAVLSLHELAGKNGKLQTRKRLMMDEIVKGVDELGVLLMGNAKGVYWYGSRLSIQQTRDLVPHNNATSLQVTVAVLAGVIWAIENPKVGIVEPEDMDFQRVLEIAGPYLGDVVGVWGNWTPLQDRNGLFQEDIDTTDPWQFKNIRVV